MSVVDFLMTLAPGSVTHKAFLREMVFLSLLDICSDVMTGNPSDRGGFSFGVVIPVPLLSICVVPSVGGRIYGAW